jgi:predicted nucleotidyltransferase
MPQATPAIIDQVAERCARHGIAQLDLPVSAARDGFNPRTSDIDMLVEFLPGARTSAFDFVELSAALEAVFGRRVDLIELDAVTNPLLREAFVRDRMPFYAAA